MKIHSHTALITGAASGMGAATAKHLASLGAHLILLDKNEEALAKFANSLNTPVIHYALDITNTEAVENALNEACEKIMAPRILVNCAGIAPSKRIISKDGVIPQTDFEKVISINLFGTFNVMRLCAAKMSELSLVDQQRGVIINTASIAAFEGQVGQAAYAASKAAIVGLTLPAARDLAKSAIRVMTIAPGIMNTPMMQMMPDKVREGLAESVPFPKRLGEAKEFASLIEHIINNDYLNGSVIRLDGALRMG